MLLSLSGEQSDTTFSLSDITSESIEGGAGVHGGEALLAFVAAAHGDDANRLDAARRDVIHTLGEAAMFDAAAVIGNFTMMTRIADSTGTPLDEGSVAMSAQIREAMGVNAYPTKRIASQDKDGHRT